MTDRTTRDQLRDQIEHRERMASIIAFAGGSVRTRAQDRAAVDALLAAGLVVPAGLTAEKLHRILRLVQRGRGSRSVPFDVEADLTTWADALELRETP